MPTRTSPSGRKQQLVLRPEKVRSGFGRWSTVMIVRCLDGHQTRLLQHSRSGFGPGGIACSHCGHAASLSTAAPNRVWRVKRYGAR